MVGVTMQVASHRCISCVAGCLSTLMVVGPPQEILSVYIYAREGSKSLFCLGWVLLMWYSRNRKRQLLPTYLFK